MARNDPARAERLAAALRDNLRRRKAQAREAAPAGDFADDAVRPAGPEPSTPPQSRP